MNLPRSDTPTWAIGVSLAESWGAVDANWARVDFVGTRRAMGDHDESATPALRSLPCPLPPLSGGGTPDTPPHPRPLSRGGERGDWI